MKTPFFWYPRENDEPSHWPTLLYPLSLLFQFGTFVRRLCARSYRASVPLICVGNVVAGGAGKTPTSLALARILKEQGHRPVFVTRGYGGTLTKRAVVHVDPMLHSSSEVGDEALLLARFAPTWASSNRAAAVRAAESHGTMIVMDDGLQNPHIMPTLSILVIDGEVGLGNGKIIPAGPLREPLADVLKRVSCAVIIGDTDTQKLAARIKLPAFRAALDAKLPLGFPKTSKFVAFAGIARPEKFYRTAQKLGLDLVDMFSFPDHHVFTQDDVDGLRLRAEEHGALMLTTEKDGVRLPKDFLDQIVELPVELSFADPEASSRLAAMCRRP